MNSETDRPDDWTTRVQRDAEPPPHVRARVVTALRDEGLLRGGSGTPRWSPWLRLAAALVLFAAGWASASAYHARADLPVPSGSRFVFLLYGETSAPGDGAARVEEYGTWARELRRQGGRVTGERLGAGGTSIGTAAPPDAAALGGFFIVEAASTGAARALAAAHPHVRYGGTIVVRPIVGS